MNESVCCGPRQSGPSYRRQALLASLAYVEMSDVRCSTEQILYHISVERFFPLAISNSTSHYYCCLYLKRNALLSSIDLYILVCGKGAFIESINTV